MKCISSLFRAMYFLIIGELLTLTAAFLERGETEYSRDIIRSIGEVPEMLEAILAAGVILFGGVLLFDYLRTR